MSFELLYVGNFFLFKKEWKKMSQNTIFFNVDLVKFDIARLVLEFSRFSTLPSCLKKRCLLQKLSKVTQP
jgi:hypothetical protein